MSRYDRGLAKLKEVDGIGGVKVVDSLRDMSPKHDKFIIEFL